MNHFDNPILANCLDLIYLILSYTSKYLNVNKIRYCFIIDLLSLCYWFVFDINNGMYFLAISCFASMVIAINGFIKWGKKGQA